MKKLIIVTKSYAGKKDDPELLKIPVFVKNNITDDERDLIVEKSIVERLKWFIEDEKILEAG